MRSTRRGIVKMLQANGIAAPASVSSGDDVLALTEIAKAAE
jgi:hypothetical protein